MFCCTSRALVVLVWAQKVSPHLLPLFCAVEDNVLVHTVTSVVFTGVMRRAAVPEGNTFLCYVPSFVHCFLPSPVFLLIVFRRTCIHRFLGSFDWYKTLSGRCSLSITHRCMSRAPKALPPPPPPATPPVVFPPLSYWAPFPTLLHLFTR